MTVNGRRTISPIFVGLVLVSVVASPPTAGACGGDMVVCSRRGDGREIAVSGARFRVASVTAEPTPFGPPRTMVFMSPSRDVCLARRGARDPVSEGAYLAVVVPPSTGLHLVSEPAVGWLGATGGVRRDGRAGDEDDFSRWAVSGEVNVTRFVPDREIAGAYDLTFASGERVTGSFDASFCGTTNETCK